MFKKILFWIDKHGERTTVILGLFTAIALVYQLIRTNEFKKYENYMTFNKIYDDWYKEMPDTIKDNCGRQQIEWKDLENDDKAWIRRYFNLYSQEYYFYKNGTIPKEIWENQIHGTNGCHGAAILNLREYPILQEGYKHWKKMGAFNHPPDFTIMLDQKIKECRRMLNENPVRCN